ncbi:MAG: calcium:proton antiporter [Proteobacteria bacterium]|nr:MAG: calcium:proton antiporter [Pseudomonadota bacterium]
MKSLLRLVVGWLSVAVIFLQPNLLATFPNTLLAALIFLWLFAVILWSSFGVVHEAEEIAELLGEPLGTLVLTLSIVIIEVALVSAVMLGASAAPTLGRDTMFAVLMIVLNGVVGLGLIVGGMRHREQAYNLQGASAYLSVLVPLTSIALILPNFTRSTSNGSLTTLQSVSFSVFTIALYVVFLLLQTGRHKSFFTLPEKAKANEPAEMKTQTEEDPVMAGKPPTELEGGSVGKHVVLLLLTLLPIVLLSKGLAKVLDFGIKELNAPAALGGILIAAIVFTPEGISALKAVAKNDLQRALNLCLGAATSTVGLTVPAILGIGLFTGQQVILGLAPTEMVLLAMTLLLSAITFSNKRTTLLEGAVHLVVFCVYIVLVFSP